MKKLLMLSVLLMVSFSLFSACYLTNGNMESWVDNGSSGPPDAWLLSGSGLTAAQEATTIHGGSYSANLTWTTTSTRWFYQETDVAEGNDYEFCFYAYDNDPDGRVRVVIRWYDNTHAFVDGYYGDYSTDTAGWQYLRSGTQTAPAGAVTAEAAIRCYDVSGWDGDATVYVDDATFCDDNCLPVELSSFYATYQSDVLALHWKTMSENNNNGWNIYRSIDDRFENSQRVNAERIDGNGTTSEAHDYTYIDDNPTETEQTYYYWIESLDNSGNSELYNPVTIEIPADDQNEPPVPSDAIPLSQNYPNPFNPETRIDFNIPQGQNATIIVYNIKGEKVKTLFNGISKGEDTLIWNGKNDDGKSVTSGVYFYKLITDNQVITKKMVMLK